MNQRIFYMTSIALLSGILILMGLIPSLGFITINPAVSFTIMHLPVLFGAYLLGWRGGLWFGLLFGMLSFFQALSNPTGLLDPFFQNPLISVLPRLLFGFLSGLGFGTINHFLKRPWLNRATLAIAGGCFTLLHTLLVLGTMGILDATSVLEALSGVGFNDTYWAFIVLILTLNGVWEILLAIVLLPTLAISTSKISSVRRIMKKRSPVR